MKKKILGTGMSGLVGSRVCELLSDDFDFEDLSLATGVDITDLESLEPFFSQSQARVVIHMAAKTDVDACEDDKILNHEGPAYVINVLGTQNVADLAKKMGKKVIYISTDFVFDGTKKVYNEMDKPNPLNWYGYTKHEGEKRVADLGVNFCILRIAYPYRTAFSQKKDFIRSSLEKIKKDGRVYGVTDHVFTPTYIDDIAVAIKTILERDLDGIYHVVGSQSLTPFDAMREIVKAFSLKAEVVPVKRKDYFKNRAFRPFKLALKNDRIKKLGVSMRGFDQGLIEMKKKLWP